jgi:hypothetical protein
MGRGRVARPHVTLSEHFDPLTVPDEIFREILTYVPARTLASFARTSKRMLGIAADFKRTIRIVTSDDWKEVQFNRFCHYDNLLILCTNPKQSASAFTEQLEKVSSALGLSVYGFQTVEVVGSKFSIELEPLLRLFPSVKHVILRKTVYGPTVSSVVPMRMLEKLTVNFFRPRELDVSNLRVQTLIIQRVELRGTNTVEKLIVRHDVREQSDVVEHIGSNDTQSCLTANEVQVEVQFKGWRPKVEQLHESVASMILYNVKSGKVMYPWYVDVSLWTVDDEAMIDEVDDDDMLIWWEQLLD